jgi:Subtilase family
MAAGENTVDTGFAEEFHGDQLVVDVQYLGMVVEQLRYLGLTPQERDRSQRLALVLLDVGELGPALAGLPDRAGLEERIRQNKKSGPADAAVPELDLLLLHLRDTFQRANNGWCPPFGKNRLLRGVEGEPHIGGEGAPRPLTATEGTVSLPARVAVGRSVRIGIVDTAIWPDARLAGRYLADTDALLRPSAGSPTSLAGHATFGASIILQQEPRADLLVKAALGQDGSAASSFDVAKKMAEFADLDVDILHLPLGCITDDHQEPLVLARATALFDQAVVVASAGNHGKDPGPAPVYPAATPGVIAVGADDRDGKKADFSPHVPWVKLTALGVGNRGIFLSGEVNVLVRDNNEIVSLGDTLFTGDAEWEGTSFAAARVTAAIAAVAFAHRVSARQAADRLMGLTTDLDLTAIPAAGDIRPFDY